MSERVRRKLEIQEIKRKEAEAGPAMKGEELQKHLKQYQMDLIRAQGELGPALPLELTPEEDDQLVKEGFLPAQE